MLKCLPAADRPVEASEKNYLIFLLSKALKLKEKALFFFGGVTLATGWRPNKEWWGVFLRLLPVTAIGLPATVTSPFFLVIWLGGLHSLEARKGILVTLSLWLIALIVLSVLYATLDTRHVMQGYANLSATLQDCRRFNVFRVYLWVVPRAMAKSVRLVATRSPRWIARGTITIARFLRYLFLLVHSEVRLLCGLDAAIGAAIGYYVGHAVIGAIAGGLIGVANFEVISKRWLHLVPSS